MNCCCGKKCTRYYFCVIKITFLWFLFLDFFGEVFWVVGKLGLSTTSYVVAVVPGEKVPVGVLCPKMHTSAMPLPSLQLLQKT